MKELVWKSALQLFSGNRTRARGVISPAFSATKQTSAAFAQPRFSSWAVFVFPNVGRDTMQTRHSASAQLVLPDAWSVTVAASATCVTAPRF